MQEAVQQNQSRVVIVGAGGRLGAALFRHYRADHEVTGFSHAQLDLAAPDQLRRTLGALEFDVLINCAAQTNVDRCEKERKEAFALNAEAPRVLAEICTEKQARLIHISTDYVFDGTKSEPYTEEDEANPISVYGESKREGERRVLGVDANHLVVRTSWVFGPDRPSFVDWIIEQTRQHDHVEAIADKISAPTYTLDLATMLKPLWSRRALAPEGLVEDEPSSTGPRAGRLQAPGGILHLANAGACSWREYGQWALDCCKTVGIALRTDFVRPIRLREMKSFIARRPVFTVLSTAKYEILTGSTPRDWHDAVAEYVREQVKRV